MLYWASQVAMVVKNPPADAGDARDAGVIPGSRRSPGVGNGNSLQYSCLEAWKNPWIEESCKLPTVHRITQNQT